MTIVNGWEIFYDEACFGLFTVRPVGLRAYDHPDNHRFCTREDAVEFAENNIAPAVKK